MKVEINWRSLVVMLAAAIGFPAVWSGVGPGLMSITLMVIIGFCLPPVIRKLN